MPTAPDPRGWEHTVTPIAGTDTHLVRGWVKFSTIQATAIASSTAAIPDAVADVHRQLIVKFEATDPADRHRPKENQR